MKLSKYLKKIKLEELLDKIGIHNIKNLNDNIMGSCPLHEDNNPSWGINKYNGQYNCFSCGDSGNLISLVSKLKHIGMKAAILYLYQYAGIKKDVLIIENKTIDRQLKKMFNEKNEIKPKIIKNNIIINLPKHVNNKLLMGIEYFKNRNINEDTLIKHGITFCTDGFYKNRAIIPIVDHKGKLITFEARDITSMSEKKVLYPKGTNVSQTIYNLNKMKQKSHVIIVEGIMDALYLSERGLNAVSVYGINISEIQEALLNKYFSTIYFCYDGDKEGQRAMIKQAKRLSSHLSVYIIILPHDKDPDNILISEFQELKNRAVEINQYISEKLLYYIKE